MASNKNQHFVPRAYLKAFSLNGDGTAISLFNLDRERFVPSAPLKHQCSRDYFYGEDLQMEKALQPVEGRYAGLVREIAAPGYLLSDEHRFFLREFWLIQHLRTEAASIRMVQFNEQMRHTAGITSDDFRMEIKEAVQIAMSTAIEQLPFVQDMKVCLLRNRTNEPFIVSDDPAILTNPWHLDSPIPKTRSFGIGAAGSIFLLPITPAIQCIAYDGDVYSIPHQNGWSEVRHVEDVHRFNQHQLLNCNVNVYAHDKGLEHSVRQQFARSKPLRPGSRHRAHYGVFISSSNGVSTFRRIEAGDDVVDHERALVHMETVHARPSAWPRQIGRRSNGAAFTDGTGLGFIRRMQLDTYGPDRFKKVRPW